MYFQCKYLGPNDVTAKLPVKIMYLVSPSSTDRPSGFTATGGTAATTAPATTWSTASAAWTAQVSEVDLQLGRNVVSWLPEVVLILYLDLKNTGEKSIVIFFFFF